MSSQLSVSIIIDNYNYGRFLGFAIESALTQSYAVTEVLVVDDGSTDNSHAVISSYGNRIIPILKENGGQGSALNAGFAHSLGDVVIFLDADDTLDPYVVERVVSLFRATPMLVRVQYRLQMIDAAGRPLGVTKPPQHSAIASGDLQQQVLLYGDDIAWLPTSGNAFSAAMLQKILPMPEAPYKICADYYLSNLSPLYGPVGSLDGVGGCYRVHGANKHEKAIPDLQFDLQQTREVVIRTRHTHTYMREHAKRLGLIRSPSLNQVAMLSVTFAANRLILLRLAPEEHPVEGDRRLAVVRSGIHAAWRRADLPLLLKGLYIVWFILAAIVPKGVLRRLAEQLFYPESRGKWLNFLRADSYRGKPVEELPV